MSRPLRSSVTDLAAAAAFQTPVRRLGGSRTNPAVVSSRLSPPSPTPSPMRRRRRREEDLVIPPPLLRLLVLYETVAQCGAGGGGAHPDGRTNTRAVRRSERRGRRRRGGGGRAVQGPEAGAHQRPPPRTWGSEPSQVQAEKGKRRIEANKASSERVAFSCTALGGQPVQSVGEPSMEQEKYLPELMAEKDSLDLSFVHAMRLLAEGKSWLSSLRVWRIFVGGLLVAIPSADVPCCHRCCVSAIRYGLHRDGLRA